MNQFRISPCFGCSVKFNYFVNFEHCLFCDCLLGAPTGTAYPPYPGGPQASAPYAPQPSAPYPPQAPYPSGSEGQDKGLGGMMSGLLGKGGGKGMLGKMNQALSEGILKVRVPFIRQGFAYIFICYSFITLVVLFSTLLIFCFTLLVFYFVISFILALICSFPRFLYVFLYCS